MLRHPRDLRDQLTVWYVTVTSLVLLAYLSAAAILQAWQLSRQMYHAEVQDVETVQGLLYFDAAGSISLHEDFYNHPQSRLLLDRLLEVRTPEGHVLFRNSKLMNRDLGGQPFSGEGDSSFNERLIRLGDGTLVMAISHSHIIEGKRVLIRLAYSVDSVKSAIIRFVTLLLAALPIALMASGFAGYRVAGKALRPLVQLTRQIEQITASHLQSRIAIVNSEDEIGQLTIVLNELLERLDAAFNQLKRFTSDVSHEMRTPLASIRSVGEVALQEPHSTVRYRDVIGSMLEEVDRLTSMTNSLLAISRAEAGLLQIERQEFSAKDLASEIIRLVGILAEEKRQTLIVYGHDAVKIYADKSLIWHALLNIVDNAVKYSPPGSEIVIQISVAANMTEIRVEDHGPGIPKSSAGMVFDRFYRVDSGRSREEGGSGLGLAIAKWAVEANGGTIGLDAERESGSAFWMRLPSDRRETI